MPIPRAYKQREIDEVLYAQCAVYYNKGYSLRQCAKKYGRSIEGVRFILKRLGVQIRKTNRRLK